MHACVMFLAVICAFSVFLKVDSKTICSQQEYFDLVVGRCSPCTDICENAAIQGTESECSKKCPDFIAPDIPRKKSEPSSPNNLAVSIGIPVAVCTVLVAVMIGLVAKNRRELREFISRHLPTIPVVKTEQQEEETTPKTPMLRDDGPAQPDASNRPEDMELRPFPREQEMVPLSGGNTVTQETVIHPPAEYKPKVASSNLVGTTV